MPQLLLELLTEEIPARMQAKAQADLERALMDGLTAAGIMPGALKAFSGPRRLVVVAEDLPVKSADVKEERKGPKVGAPEKAIAGFMRGAGLASIDDAEIREDKKGQFYVAVIEKPGKATTEIVADLVPSIIRGFHWPKSMRWGEGDLRWVRPLQRILCTFDGEVVPFEVDGIASDNITEGHRVMGRGPYTVRRWDDYEETLQNKGFVVLDREARKETILHEANTLCQAQNLELVEDIGLLEEVAGLAEYPVVIMGDMDPEFLSLPPEVIRLSMRVHQKYFAVRDPKTGELAPKFIVVANMKAADGGKTIAAGNAKVLSARLSDAVFFWENDKASPLEDNFEKLGSIVFHEKLGTVQDKAERVIARSGELAEKYVENGNRILAERASKLAKCDLVSDMVFEFTELEGVMGRYYYRAEKGLYVASPGPEGFKDQVKAPKTPAAGQENIESIIVADAIRDHYKPKGPSDAIPTEPTAVAVALADKLDTLAGFWAIDEKPTDSKDPYALRRAALGVIRLVLENEVRLGLSPVLEAAIFDVVAWGGAFNIEKGKLTSTGGQVTSLQTKGSNDHIRRKVAADLSASQRAKLQPVDYSKVRRDSSELKQRLAEGFRIIPIGGRNDLDVTLTVADLLSFFADRLKVYLRDQGKRHDLIDAVFALGEDDLVLIVKRVEALSDFLATEDGANLLAGYKRAVNILSIEEKKDGKSYDGKVATKALVDDAERELHAALQSAVKDAESALMQEDFETAMTALSRLRAPVDRFFDDVMVNADDAKVRENRLNLLAQIRDVVGRVADFSKIEG